MFWGGDCRPYWRHHGAFGLEYIYIAPSHGVESLFVWPFPSALVHALGPQKVIEGGFGGSSLEPRDESTWQEWEAFSAGSRRPRGRV